MKRVLAIALLVAAGASPGLADPTYGPAFGANSFTASIDDANAIDDADDYVAPLVAGETLSVTVTVGKTSALLPALTLVAPDGTVTLLAPPAVVEKKAGKVVTLSRFVLPTTGRWTVRVTGKNDTEGAYSIKFAIGAAKPATLKLQHLGGADPLSRDVVVNGVDGALLDVTLKWPRTQAAVHIGAVKDPSGAENTTGTPPVEKPGSAKLTRRTLHQGSGAYTVGLSIASGEVTYSVTTKVTPQARPKGKKPVALSVAEPFLEVRATPIRGDGGLTAHLTGTGFPSAPLPKVFFGGVEGTGVVVAPGGTGLDVVVPPGAANSTVEVAVVQADGQASVRPAYFVYVPLPSVTDLTTPGGQPIRGGSSAGGQSMTLVGTGFLAGQTVRIGGQAGTGAVAVDAQHITFVTPSVTSGLVPVVLDDEFGRPVTAAFQFESKDPPAFALTPYSPAFAPTAGGSTITINGTAFETTDQLRFDGAALASTFVDATTRRFVAPARPAGLYSVALVDRFGVVTAGPQFEVKDPPAFGSPAYSPPVAPPAGGTTITITGSGFETTDQLRFNGANLASTFVTSTTRTFSSPALAAGVYAVALVDRFGIVSTGPTFELKNPPAFGATPYSPVVALTTGGTTVTITGSGFEATDVVRFNGLDRPTTFNSSTSISFTTPVLSFGLYGVQIIDRYNIIVTGPAYELKAPLTIDASPYTPAFGTTAGGTTILLTGVGFESTDQLRFNGVNFTSQFLNSTQRRFVSPAMAAGSYTVALVDRIGAVVTGPNFTIKDPPTFASSPYSPAGAPSTGGATITITGTGFESTDQLRFNGVNLNSTFVNVTTRRFTSPVIAAGSYPVALVDRFGVVVTGPNLEVKTPPAFASTPYSPTFGPLAGGVTVTISGTGFESTDQLRFAGQNLNSTFVSSTTRRFTAPSKSAGSYSVELIDRFGGIGTGPTFVVQGAPTITSVQATAGPFVTPTTIAVHGGATITVAGTGFVSGDTVTLGGASATITSQSATQIRFTAPAGTFGTASLVISDIFGQGVSSDALSYVGYDDATTSRQPGTTGADNFLAHRGAIGDLDNDGAADDLAIITYPYTYIGTRYVLTRIFFESSGTLVDQTDSNFPAMSSHGDAYGADAITIGDLDADGDADIAIAGSSFSYYDYTTYSVVTMEARLFANDGKGGFSQSAYQALRRTSPVTCTDQYKNTFRVFSPYSFPNGYTTALAIGDLDRDGLADIVTATSHYRSGAVFIPPVAVTFTPGSYYSFNAKSNYTSGYYYYASATRVFRNLGSGGFEDDTFPRIPLCGQLPSTYTCFPGRDVKLGDLDGDGSLDIVTTWDDPTTTTPLGQYNGTDSARIATQVLINDGNGFFNDQTSRWMPRGSSPEFWQGNRMEIVDLDGDRQNDLVILHADFLDGSTTTVSSLRILQNQGSSFVDVTSSAMPRVPLSGTQDDNLRGRALAVRDVDGDGNLDILVGTTEQLFDSSGIAVRSTRLLRGDGSLHFAIANEFLPLPSVDTGEARDLLLGDLAGSSVPSLILLTDSSAGVSTNGELLRVFDWR